MDEPIRVRLPSEPPSTDAAEAFAGYLDELERLCEAATPGPWRLDAGEDRLTAPDGSPIAEAWGGKRRFDDARFIEAARHALPKLIAFVRTADLDGAASLDAFDAIAAMVGCSEWDYPGQLVRDVQTLKGRAERAESRLAAMRRSLEEAHRSPPWNWRDTIGYLLDRDAQHDEVQR